MIKSVYGNTHAKFMALILLSAVILCCSNLAHLRVEEFQIYSAACKIWQRKGVAYYIRCVALFAFWSPPLTIARVNVHFQIATSKHFTHFIVWATYKDDLGFFSSYQNPEKKGKWKLVSTHSNFIIEREKCN